MEFTKGKHKDYDVVRPPLALPERSEIGESGEINCRNDHTACDDHAFDSRRVWVGNIDIKVAEYAILKLVQPFGELEKIDFLYHQCGPDKGKPRGFCFITFKNESSAQRAISQLNGFNLKNKRLAVKQANSEKSKKEELSSPAPIDKDRTIAAIEAKLRLMQKGESLGYKPEISSIGSHLRDRQISTTKSASVGRALSETALSRTSGRNSSFHVRNSKPYHRR